MASYPDEEDADASTQLLLGSGGGAQQDDVFTTDGAIETIGLGNFHNRALLITATVQLANGLMLTSLPFLGFGVKCVTWPSVHGDELPYLATSILLGMVVGSVVFGWLADNRGRRNAVVWGSAVTGVFGAVSALSPSFSFLVLVRSIVGFGMGAGPAAMAIYLEFLPRRARGSHGILYLSFFSFGAILCVCLAWFIMPRYGWRVLTLIASLPAMGVSALAYLYLDESPRFLMVHHHTCDATEVLLNMAQENHTTLPSGVLTQRLVTRNDGIVTQLTQLCTGSLLRSTTWLLCLAFFLMSLVYFCIAVMAARVVPAPEPCHVTNSQYVAALVGHLVELPGLLVAALVIDRLGRRKSMAVFATSAGLMLMLLMVHSHNMQLAALAAARMFSMAMNRVLWVYTAEIFPSSVRGIGLGVVMVCSRIGSLLAPVVAFIAFPRSEVTALTLSFACAVWIAGLALTLPYETSRKALFDFVPPDIASVQKAAQFLATPARGLTDSLSDEADDTEDGVMYLDNVQ